MLMSESVNELAAALAKAQGQMEAAIKDASNPHFKSRYATLAAVWIAIRKALSENQLAVVQCERESSKDEVILDTILLHSSGQWISGTGSYPVSRQDAQGRGSALTYARRYSLMAMVGIAPDDDDGNAAVNAKPQDVAYAKKVEAKSVIIDAILETDQLLAVEDFKSAIQGATTPDELAKLLPEIGKLPEAARKVLRQPYADKLASLA